MFTIKCFIRKNTPELRKKLEEFGYKNRHLSMSTNIENYPLLLVYHDGYYQGVFGDECGLEFYIDCEDNEELFLAIAALRDDTDDYQWFVWDDIEAGGEKFKQYIPGEPWQDWWWFEVHKATVEELIEHFK